MSQAWRTMALKIDDPFALTMDQRLVSFMATRPNGEQVLLGAGFILYSSGGLSLCVTAAHVLAFAEDEQRPQRAAERQFERLFGLPKDRLRIEPESFRALGIDSAGQTQLFVAHQVCRSNTTDAGTVWLAPQSDDGTMPLFARTECAVNATQPSVGSEVVVVSHVPLAIESQTVDGDVRRTLVRRQLGFRRGTVTEVDDVGDYLGIGPNFTTTVPLPAGASGAPVFALPERGAPLVLRGVVSSDLSVLESFDDTRIAGAGRVAGIRSVLVLPLSARTRRPIADLYQGGAVPVDLRRPDDA
jgi:hypothetical protein